MVNDMICRVCGFEIPLGSEFCPKCGARAIPAFGEILSDEEYLALESEALKSTIQRDLEELEAIMLNERESAGALSPEGFNFGSLSQVARQEVTRPVRPATIARWRTFLPEPLISIIINHYDYTMSIRQVEKWVKVPDFPYTMPELPEIVEAPRVYAMATDTDGWLRVRVRLGRDTIGRTRERRRIYRRIFYTPEVAFETDTLELTKNVATALGVAIAPLPPRLPKRKPSFRATARYARAVRATHLMQPHFIKLENIAKADEILNLYKGNTTITIARDKTL